MAKIIGKNDFNTEVMQYKGVSLVDFYADWCMPCKMIAPIIEEIGHEMGNKAKVLKLNIDQTPEIAESLGIMSIPTLIIFKEGKVVEQMRGFQTKNTLKSKLEKYL